ncbi:MAG: hypothetical protein GY708_05690 [Actinomycetia bacterium]|nr:hypothetical protein [Actinomycetes bacterium]MCP4958734.1 hypothetical protein [Actinomycetes bacterium]
MRPASIIGVVALVLCAQACTGNAESQAPMSLSGIEAKSAAVEVAVSEFDVEFPVRAVEILRVGGDVGIGDIGELMAPLRIVRERPSGNEPYWELLEVRYFGSHWEVDLASVHGANYFAGTLFVVVDGVGARLVDPFSVGGTPTTSIS